MLITFCVGCSSGRRKLGTKSGMRAEPATGVTRSTATGLIGPRLLPAGGDAKSEMRLTRQNAEPLGAGISSPPP